MPRPIGGPKRSPSMSAQAAHNYRMGGAGAMGIMALSNGMKTLESIRYGEIGNAALHATMAAGAGIGAYHTFYRTPQFTNAMNTSATYISKRAQGSAPQTQKFIRNTANFLTGLSRIK